MKTQLLRLGFTCPDSQTAERLCKRLKENNFVNPLVEKIKGQTKVTYSSNASGARVAHQLAQGILW